MSLRASLFGEFLALSPLMSVWRLAVWWVVPSGDAPSPSLLPLWILPCRAKAKSRKVEGSLRCHPSQTYTCALLASESSYELRIGPLCGSKTSVSSNAVLAETALRTPSFFAWRTCWYARHRLELPLREISSWLAPWKLSGLSARWSHLFGSRNPVLCSVVEEFCRGRLCSGIACASLVAGPSLYSLRRTPWFQRSQSRKVWSRP